MNKNKRQMIQEVINQLEGIKSSIAKIQEEEEKYFHDTPENIKGGVLSKLSVDIIDGLDGALDNLSDSIYCLDKVKKCTIL